MVLIVAVPVIIDIKMNSRCPELGRKRTPTNHGPREKQSDKEQRSQHAKTPDHQDKRLRAESSNSQTTFEKYTKVKLTLKIVVCFKIPF